jgi:uncharacterized protein (UPF0147 family)
VLVGVIMNDDIQEIIDYMDELHADSNLPRTVKAKFKDISLLLKSNISEEELSLKINQFLAELDDISTDSNLDAFSRQQIWSISSMLESLSQ